MLDNMSNELGGFAERIQLCAALLEPPQQTQD